MATDAYMKTAAGQVRQGVETLKREATEIRSAAATQRQHLEREMTAKVAAMKGEQMRLQSLGSNPQSAALTQDVQRLQNEIEDIKQQLSKLASESEQQARQKESAMQTLTSEASNLERMAGDSRLQ